MTKLKFEFEFEVGTTSETEALEEIVKTKAAIDLLHKVLEDICDNNNVGVKLTFPDTSDSYGYYSIYTGKNYGKNDSDWDYEASFPVDDPGTWVSSYN